MPQKPQKPQKGKGNLMKVPTKADLERDALISALRWTWSYEKDDLAAELFGIDDQWTKKIYFDRPRRTMAEQDEYPNLLKPPPWIDTGDGKPAKVCMSICTSEVCISGGWMPDPSKAARAAQSKRIKKVVKSMALVSAAAPEAVNEGSLRMDEMPTDKSCPSVWAVHRSKGMPAVVYGKVIPASQIQAYKLSEKYIKWLAKLREPAERAAAAAAQAAAEEQARQAEEEGGEKSDGKKKGKKKKRAGGMESECEAQSAPAAPDDRRGRGHESGSYWADWEPVKSPFYPANGLPGLPFLATEAARWQERCTAAHELVVAEMGARNAMPAEQRAKKKQELLEPGLHALELARVSATMVTPARIDRWGVEYDCRWLSSARSKGFRQLRVDFTDIWRDDEAELLVVPGVLSEGGKGGEE